MKKVLVFFIALLSGTVSAQQTGTSFLLFNNNYCGNNFKPVFALSGSSTLSRTENNFKLLSPQKKPVFCRMEDELCNTFNVCLQLRAGSDQDYRNLAFPEKIDKRSKLIE